MDGVLNKNWKQTNWGAYTFALCSAAAVYVALTHLGAIFRGVKTFTGFFTPVFMGLILAYIMDPLTGLLQRSFFNGHNKRLNRIFAVIASIVLVLLLVVLLFAALVPQIINSVLVFASNIEVYSRSLQEFTNRINSITFIDMSRFFGYINEFFEKWSAGVAQNADKIINTSFSIGSALFEVVISFILAIYFLMDKERGLRGLSDFVKLITPENRFGRIAEFFGKCNDILVRYIICEILDALIIGITNCLFMTIMRMPYAALISVVVGVTNLAPTFGPIAGAAIGGFILLLVNPWSALWFLIFTLVLQTFDGYILKPRLFGGSLGVPSIWILVSIIVGGRMFGVAGILLGIPFAAIVSYAYSEIFERKLKNKKDRKE